MEKYYLIVVTRLMSTNVANTVTLEFDSIDDAEEAFEVLDANPNKGGVNVTVFKAYDEDCLED